MEKFANKKFCSLALDAGKVNSLPMLAVCLINPFNNIGSFLYKIIFYFGGHSIDYKNEVNIILDDLIERNIVITSFIGDNYRAQTCALKSDGDESIQKTSDVAYKREIEWTSCACHTTALGFNDTIDSIELLSNFKNNLKIIVNFFRLKTVTSQLQLICPSYCATRWTNFTDIILFL